jgi:uncharacterized protein
MPSLLKPSKYNRAVSYGDKWLLFNGVTSSMVLVNPTTYQKLRPMLFEDQSFSTSGIDDPEINGMLDRLTKARFVVDHTVDELEYMKQRYRRNQYRDPVSVTIATTLDCNLGCYYCYEEREKSYLSKETCDRIFSYLAREVEAAPDKRLLVSWYGGEPMMNVEAVEYLSPKLIEYCTSNNVHYSAHMVSNGTCWPENPEECAAFIKRHKIYHIQFTFDGLPQHHNNRRHYLKKEENQISSFDALVRTVNSLVGHTRIYLRLNLDKGNWADAYELVEFFHDQGWLFPGSKVFPYAAPLSPYTSACASVEKTSIEHLDFNRFQLEFQRYLSKYCDLREFVSMNYFPDRATRLICGAVSSRALLFGPDGRMYKCIHDLGIHLLSHGQVNSSPGQVSDDHSPGPGSELFPILASTSPGGDSSKPHDYMSYDPFTHPSCSKCEYLPICFGGCPKTQFERNKYFIDSFKLFWDSNLDQMLRTYADIMQNQNTSPLEPLFTPFGAEAVRARRELQASGIM